MRIFSYTSSNPLITVLNKKCPFDFPSFEFPSECRLINGCSIVPEIYIGDTQKGAMINAVLAHVSKSDRSLRCDASGTNLLAAA